MKSTSIDIVGLKKRYGKRDILRGVSLNIEFGSCIGILGGNGSGKTTILSILAGITDADEGEFICEGYDLLKDDKRRRFLVGIIPQCNPLIEELSAKDNLLLWHDRKYLDISAKEGIIRDLGITKFINKRVSTLSEGMKKRLSMILLMDEPSAALDITAKEVIHEYIKKFTAIGGIVILVTHDEGELGLCDRHYILKDGVLNDYSFDGNMKKLVNLIGD